MHMHITCIHVHLRALFLLGSESRYCEGEHDATSTSSMWESVVGRPGPAGAHRE